VVSGQPGRATEVLRLLEESPALTPDEVTLAVGRLCGFAASYEEQSREVLREVVKRQHEARGCSARLFGDVTQRCPAGGLLLAGMAGIGGRGRVPSELASAPPQH